MREKKRRDEIPVTRGAPGTLGANMTWEELDEKVNTYPMDRKFQAIGPGGQAFVDEVVALIEALFADCVYAYFGWGYDSQGYFVELDKLYKAEGGEQVCYERMRATVVYS